MKFFAQAGDEVFGSFNTESEASVRMHKAMDDLMSEGVTVGETTARVIKVPDDFVDDFDIDDPGVMVLIEYMAVMDDERNEVALPKQVGYDFTGWAKWDLRHHYLLMPNTEYTKQNTEKAMNFGDCLHKSGFVSYIKSKIEKLALEKSEGVDGKVLDVVALQGKLDILNEILSDIDSDFGVVDLDKESMSLEYLRQAAEERTMDFSSSERK